MLDGQTKVVGGFGHGGMLGTRGNLKSFQS